MTCACPCLDFIKAIRPELNFASDHLATSPNSCVAPLMGLNGKSDAPTFAQNSVVLFPKRGISPLSEMIRTIPSGFDSAVAKASAFQVAPSAEMKNSSDSPSSAINCPSSQAQVFAICGNPAATICANVVVATVYVYPLVPVVNKITEPL